MLSPELALAYKNEDLATEAFKQYRLKKGIVCKKCGGRVHYWLEPKHQFQCRLCKFRTTLRSGTVLEGSKLPISYFFITLQLMVEKGPNVTIRDVQEITAHKYYEPLWAFLHRVRQYIRENEYQQVLADFKAVINQDGHFQHNGNQAAGA